MTAIECPAWVADLGRQDREQSAGVFDLHPASTRAALAFAAGDMKTVKAGETIWLAGGGWVEVVKVTKSLLHTSGGKFHRATGCRWQSWHAGFLVAFRTREASQ